LQLIRAGIRAEARRLEIYHITNMLKQFAEELDLPVLLSSQLNRRFETRDNKRPVLADLRESGDIEQDARRVIFLCRDSY
jgi:replicative DNA helicase